MTYRPTYSQVLLAYQNGLFPMGLGDGGTGPYGWWAPERRGVLQPGDLHVSKSLRKSIRTFRFTTDTVFNHVLEACADPNRDGAWISEEIKTLYRELHSRGYAHSVEVWQGEELVGGLYGVAIGHLFAGESMFHTVTDASKAALVELVRLLDDAFGEQRWLIDTQWQTAHLASLGVSEISSFEYMRIAKTLTKSPFTQEFLTK